MSKAFAYATSMDGEVYFTRASDKSTVDWLDDQGHVNMPLYTTDHAEELARALAESRMLLNRMIMKHYNDGIEDASDLLKCLLDSDRVLNNYREATK